jgi:phage recombination protein Bet
METATRSSTKADAPHAAGVAERMGLIQWAATRFGEVEAGKVMGILRATCFRTGPRDDPATDAEVAALLIVARNYDLNPFTKEIFAFKDKYKGIVPIVSIDGWASLVNRHPDFDGVEFEYGPELTAPHGGKKAFEWVKCRMFNKRRSHPIDVTEYLDEVYQSPRGENQTHGPWQTHPKRMERHKAYIQCARLAFGFGGIYDEDEGERIIGSSGPEIVLSGPVEGAGASASTAVSTEVAQRREGEHEPAKQPGSKLAADLRKQAASAEDADLGDKVAGTSPTPTPAPAPTPTATPAPAEVVTAPIPAGPSIAGARKDIAAAGSLEDLNKVLLEQVMKLPASAERDKLMLEWNVKVQKLSAAMLRRPRPPPAKPPARSPRRRRRSPRQRSPPASARARPKSSTRSWTTWRRRPTPRALTWCRTPRAPVSGRRTSRSS